MAQSLVSTMLPAANAPLSTSPTTLPLPMLPTPPLAFAHPTLPLSNLPTPSITALAADPSSTTAQSKSQSKYSQSIPFLRRPPALTGEFAGDVGFDPLNFAKSRGQLIYMREAEVKHGRLAMLAAVGWPLSELYDTPLATQFNLPPLLDDTDRVPSVLNGGMDSISPLWWGFCIGLTAAIDLKGVTNARYADLDGKDGSQKSQASPTSQVSQMLEKEYYLPGDYGFDPLNLYPPTKEGRQRMQLAEIKHGRLSMIAVTGFAVQEAVSKVGVVDETPLFFEPLHFGF